MSTHPELKILMLEDVPEEAEVQALAEGYQSSAITTMIERYRNSCSRSGS